MAVDRGIDENTLRMMEELPDNCDIGELCDCGRHKNLKTSKRNMLKSIPVHKRPTEPMLSDYQRTFRPGDTRPRSSKRPLPSPRDPHPPPMMFNTVQRSDFKDNGYVEREKPFIKNDEYVPDRLPLEGVSYYAQEFTLKPLPNQEAAARPMTQNRYLRATSSKFDGRTTNKEYFKQWVHQPKITFRELPSFTGSILYPEKPSKLQSVTQHSFPGAYAPKKEPVKIYEGNIKLEGNMDLLTTNRATYKGDKASPAMQLVRKPQLNPNRRAKSTGKTQTQVDYAAKSIQRARPIAPAPETIEIGHDRKTYFSTEQRSRFPGHDVNSNPVPKPFNPTSEEFQKPTVPLDCLTLTQNDFKPHDINEAFIPKAKIQPTRYSDDLPKFDGRTTYKELHQNWGSRADPRVRHGDFHEAHKYVPPMGKYDISSTTRTTFTPKKAEPVKLYKPEEKPIQNSGEQDFRTVNRETYKPVEIPMCKAQVYLMKQELRKQFREFQSSRAQNRVEAN